MDTIKWAGYNWITQQEWGTYHPGQLWQWYDPDQVKLKEDGSIDLSCTFKEKNFPPPFPPTIPNAVGLIISVETFGYGEFKATLKLPNIPHAWPSFWIHAEKAWPPEIDVFEGYSNRLSSYFHFRIKPLCGFWDLQTNVHYKDSGGENTHLKGENHWMGLKNPKKHYLEYKLIRLPDSLEIYHNGILVKHITPETSEGQLILDQLRGKQIHVLFSSWVQKKQTSKNYTGTMNVKDFTFTPHF